MIRIHYGYSGPPYSAEGKEKIRRYNARAIGIGGGLVGFALGGPIGAFLGSTVGAVLGNKLDPESDRKH